MRSLIQKEAGKAPLWFFGFILLLLLFPLPFGGNRPWASDLFGLLISISMLWLLARQLFVSVLDDPFAFNLGKHPPRRRLFFSLVSFSLVLFWAWLQTQSWMPEAWHHPMWDMAAPLIGKQDGSITLNASLFPEAALRMMSYAGCFVLAFYGCRDGKVAELAVRWLAYGAGAYALYGLLMHSMNLELILWYEKWAYEGFLTSTFVNKNSYAAYAGLGLLCCMGQLYLHLRNVRIKDEVLARKSRFLARLTSLGNKDLLAFLPVLFVLGALILTGSRAGIVSSFVGLGVFTIAVAINKRMRRRQMLLPLNIIAGLFIVFVALGGDALLSRLGESQVNDDADMRIEAYELATQTIADNPWLGYGLGNFEEAFRIYRTDRLTLWYHHAHNDYLEMMIDLGVPMALLLFLSIAALASCCLTGVRTRKRGGLYPAIGLGATALVGAHAFVDFSLHIPAVAATYAALLGVGVAQSWSSREEE